MNAATLERARAAVASPHWRWMPGMQDASGLRVEDEERNGEVWVSYCGGQYMQVEHMIPDLDDPVTVEAVGILAREAWGAAVIEMREDIAPWVDEAVVWWTVRTLRGVLLRSDDVRVGDVEPRVAGYVAALLAAPPREVER